MPTALAAAVTDPPSSSMAFDLSMGHTLARLPLHRKYAYCGKGFNPAYMTTLQERMVELMTATGWTVGEIARIAGVTSAAVSQWVGNGKGKQSKSIGDINAAMRLEKASGFRGLWLAKGAGAKLVEDPGTALTEETRPEPDAFDAALEVIAKALAEVDEEGRALVGHSLSRLAHDPSKLGSIAQHLRMLVFTNVTAPSTSDDAVKGQRLTVLPRGIGPENDGTDLRVPAAQRSGQK